MEDNPQCLAVLKAQLDASGYRTVTANNGQDALAQARAHLPRLILLDLHMPVMDGLQFRLAQLADASLATIPVIMISAHHEAVEVGRRLGAVGIFVKADDPKVLLDLVAEHVPD